MKDYKNGSHTVWDRKYHLVWITKYRYPVLVGDVGLRSTSRFRAPFGLACEVPVIGENDQNPQHRGETLKLERCDFD